MEQEKDDRTSQDFWLGLYSILLQRRGGHM
jgi:hypothetical protein